MKDFIHIDCKCNLKTEKVIFYNIDPFYESKNLDSVSKNNYDALISGIEVSLSLVKLFEKNLIEEQKNINIQKGSKRLEKRYLKCVKEHNKRIDILNKYLKAYSKEEINAVKQVEWDNIKISRNKNLI